MTEANRIYLKLGTVGLVAAAVGILAIYWSRSLASIVVVLASFFVVAYVVFIGLAFGRLCRRLSAMNATDAEAARDEFFRPFRWLQWKRQQANNAAHADARGASHLGRSSQSRAGGRER